METWVFFSYTLVMSDGKSKKIAFLKMHGLGNDFVIIDARVNNISMRRDQIKKIGNRRFGVGFDQLAIIEARQDVDAHLKFFNSDGSETSTCGNATRCIASYLMDELGQNMLKISTDFGMLSALKHKTGEISVNMGHPKLQWNEIPLSAEVDTLRLPIDGEPVATSIGNPHCTFFVDNVDAVDLPNLGKEIEHHPIFPERANVQFVSILGNDHLRVRVWERGVGITMSSGYSSCAAVVAAHRRKITGKNVKVDLDGGSLNVKWETDGIWITGPTAHVFNGFFTKEFLEL